MKIGILTSSRADYGIYLPLINQFFKDNTLNIELIVFGTHLSKFHGYTIDNIENKTLFKKIHKIEHILASDTPSSVNSSMGLVFAKFGDFWNNNEYDIVLCLGDRFEMAAAVLSGLPFGVIFGHLHGGETTLGAIDNVYRHSITLASKYHFTSTSSNKKRVEELKDTNENIYDVGSLSNDYINEIPLLTKSEFLDKWGIDLNKKTVLVTVHPETIEFSKNEFYAEEIYQAIDKVSENFQVIITLPNADTGGILFREKFNSFKTNSNVFLIENFGSISYFTCVKNSDLVIGNSSSGIIEVASFKKHVLNIGDRQKGREISENTIHIPFNKTIIIENINKYAGKVYEGNNIYFKGGVVHKIYNIIKNIIHS